MWFDDQFENAFQRLSNRFFNSGDIFENPIGSQVQTYGPYYYGYELTLGSDDKPHVREWGNVRPTNALTDDGIRKPFVDETVDEKNGILKLVSEMPGIEKSDIQIQVADNIVSISAEHGDRKYGTNIPLKYKVDENSVKAKYLNGIVELTFKLAEKPKGKLVSVE
jgi:HSP20 family protein